MLEALPKQFILGGCLAKIRGMMPSLSRSEKKLASFILGSPEAPLRHSSRELGHQVDVSEATVIRFCQSIGYDGYIEFRTALGADLLRFQKTPYLEISQEDNTARMFQKVFQMTSDSLSETLLLLDPKECEQAITVICKAKHVALYGMAGSCYIAREFNLILLRLGVPAQVWTEQCTQAASVALLGLDDVAFGISHTGSAVDVVEALRIARENGATTICLTNYFKSSITEASDIKLFTSVRPIISGAENAPSRVAQLCILDALATGIALQKFGR